MLSGDVNLASLGLQEYAVAMKHLTWYGLAGLILLMTISVVMANDSDQCVAFCTAAAACNDPAFKTATCLDICGGMEENLQPGVANNFLACQMKDICHTRADNDCLQTASVETQPLPELSGLLTVFCSKMNACGDDSSRLEPKRCVELFTEQRLGVFLSAQGIARVTDCLKTCDCKGIDACFNRIFQGRSQPAMSSPKPTTPQTAPPKKVPLK